MPKPLRLRKLKADMELKELKLRTVAERAEVPYTVASELLSGKRVDAVRLSKIENAINSAPTPAEETAP